MPGCPFKNALGVPGEGIHSIRFLGIALNDTLMTIIGAILTSYSFNINLGLSLFLWFFTGEVLHYGFGVNTAILKMIGMSPDCSL